MAHCDDNLFKAFEALKSIMCKISCYTNFVTINDKVVAFNSFKGGIVQLDEKTMKQVSQGHFSDLPNNVLDTLKEGGIIVEEGLNEKALCKYQHDLIKYRNRSCYFLVAVTYKCNLACPYCYEGAGKEKHQGHSTRDNAVQISKFIENVTLQSQGDKLKLIFYGGEPLINLQILGYILETLRDFSKQNLMEFDANVVTNGTLLTEEMIEDLKQKGLEGVYVSIDGPQQIHDKRRVSKKDGKGTYEEIMKNIGLLLRKKLTVELLVNVDKESSPYIPDLFDDLNKRGYSRLTLRLLLLKPATNIVKDYPHFILNQKEAEKVQMELNFRAVEKGFSIKPIQLGLEPKYVSCPYLTTSSYVIGPQGDLYKCWASLGNKEKMVGEIQEDGSLKVTPYYYEFMSKDPFTQNKCPNCKFLPLCGGGCPLLAEMQGGSLHTKMCSTLFLTDAIKVLIEQNERSK